MPYFRPWSQIRMPHFRRHFGSRTEALIPPQNTDNPQMRLALRRGAISETHWFPTISLKLRKIVGDLSQFQDPIRPTLIAAKDAPFSASFRSSSRGPVFYPVFGHPLALIRQQQGAILETNGVSAIFLKFRKNRG